MRRSERLTYPEVAGGGASDHGRLVTAELAVQPETKACQRLFPNRPLKSDALLLPKLLLRSSSALGIDGRVKSARAGPAREPVSTGKALYQRHEILLDLLLAEHGNYLAKRLDGLDSRPVSILSRVDGWCRDPTFSRTTVSSTAAKFSSGPKRMCACSGPPT